MKSPAFQFYAADYLADENVQTMTLEEEGAYIRLLAYCWREGSIPNDDEKLSRLAKGASTIVISIVRLRFAVSAIDCSRLIHKRLDNERERQRAWREKCAKGGLASVESRRNSSAVVQQPLEPKTNTSVCSLQSSSSINRVHKYPSNEADARASSVLVGVDPDFAAQVWHEMEGICWKDAAGRSIENWPSYLKGRWGKDVNRKSELKQKGSYGKQNNGSTSGDDGRSRRSHTGDGLDDDLTPKVLKIGEGT